MSGKKAHQPKPSHSDWNKIHAKAWKDAKFRELLENDPRKAIAQWGDEHGIKFDKVVQTAEPADENIAPPACC